MISRSKQNNFDRVISDDQIRSYNITQRAKMSAAGYALAGEESSSDSFKAIESVASGLYDSIRSKEPVITQPAPGHTGILGGLNNALDNIFGHNSLKRMDKSVNNVVGSVGDMLGTWRNYAVIGAAILILILILKK